MRFTYKTMSYAAGLFVIAILGILGPACAQSTADDANREQLMHFAANNANFDKVVEQTARDLYRLQVSECTNTDQVIRQLPTAYGNITFPIGSGGTFPSPNHGVWAEHVKIRGCGHVWQINMLAVGQRNADPLLLALMPGDTLADPSSQRSAERNGAIAVKRSDATCADDAQAGYTRLLGYKQSDKSVGKTDAGQGWFEQWNFKFCQKDIPVQMAFLPNGSGGYEIKARVIGFVEKTEFVPAAKPVDPTMKTPAPAPMPTEPTGPLAPSKTLN